MIFEEICQVFHGRFCAFENLRDLSAPSSPHAFQHHSFASKLINNLRIKIILHRHSMIIHAIHLQLLYFFLLSPDLICTCCTYPLMCFCSLSAKSLSRSSTSETRLEKSTRQLLNFLRIVFFNIFLVHHVFSNRRPFGSQLPTKSPNSSV